MDPVRVAPDATRSHPRSRLLGLAAFAIILVLATVAVPLLAGASTYRGGVTVNASGTTVDGNLSVASFRSRLDADIAGDLTLASFSSSVYGDVGGSVHALGGRTAIYGNVSGTVYVASGTVDVHGVVRGDLVIASGRVRLREGSRVDGDVVIFAGQVDARGTVGGTLYGSALMMDQRGRIGGNLEIQADRLSVGGSATIGGDLRYQSPTDATIGSGVTVVGVTERTNATPWTGIGAGALSPFGPALKLVWSLLAGAVLVAIAPRLMSRFAELAAPVGQPIVLGAIGLVAIPVFAVLLIVTILGLPVGVLALMAFGASLYLSQVVVGLTIGRFLLPRRWRDGSRGYLLLAMTIGVILIDVVRMLPVPFVNMAVVALVTLLGLGAILSLVPDLTSDRLRATTP